jgi:hypothetical protein
MYANFKVNKYWTRPYECQVGFIRGAESTFRGSPGMTLLYYEVNPVTALHNVNVFNHRDAEFKEAQLVFGTQGSDKFNLDFAVGGMDVSKLQPYALRDHDSNVSVWNAGLDLIWGDRIAGKH